MACAEWQSIIGFLDRVGEGTMHAGASENGIDVRFSSVHWISQQTPMATVCVLVLREQRWTTGIFSIMFVFSVHIIWMNKTWCATSSLVLFQHRCRLKNLTCNFLWNTFLSKCHAFTFGPNIPLHAVTEKHRWSKWSSKNFFLARY